MARAAALALLDQGPAPLHSIHKALNVFGQAEVRRLHARLNSMQIDAALLLLEQEKLVRVAFVIAKEEKLKVLYRSGKVDNANDNSPASSSTPSSPPAAAAKAISPALRERLDRKRALMPLEQEEARLTSTIKLRKAKIEDLKRNKALAEKSANPGELERLQTLSLKWGNASREIVRALQPHAPGSTLGEMLKALRIPPEMLGYSAVDDDFTGDFKSLDQISHDEPEEAPREAEPEDNEQVWK